MNRKLYPLLATALTCGIASMSAQAAVTLLGTGSIPGTATDQSGLSGLLEDGVTPKNQVGGLGSALAYSGSGDVFYAVPDRGPADGATTYPDRLYTLSISLSANGPFGTNAYTVTPTVTATALLTRKSNGANFNGSSLDFDASNSPQQSNRFDPEGVRVDKCGKTVFISDEYGPFLYRFDIATGTLQAPVRLPNKFLIDVPSAVTSPVAEELTKNLFGRQLNRGMEGLAISPNGQKLYGLMQSPLIQDGGLDASYKRVGTNVRLLEIDRLTGSYREFLYVLEGKDYGVNEILAVNDHQFLVIERDGKAGSSAAFKRIYKIDISGATDIHRTPSLPSTGVPSGVVPVSKSLFIDLLDPAFGLSGSSFPEKIEGLAFGAPVSGRISLVVSSDNDFVASNPSRFYVFGIDTADLPGFQKQTVKSCATE